MSAPIPVCARLDAAAGIAGDAGVRWLIGGRLFGGAQDKEGDVRTLMIFSFVGLTLSLFAAERFPAIVAAIAASP